MNARPRFQNRGVAGKMVRRRIATFTQETLMSYTTSRQPPRTLTTSERNDLLKITSEHKDGFRDHLIFSTALGTALREHEILALNLGDVYDQRGKAKTRIRLRVFKRSNMEPDAQEVFVPDSLRYKFEKFWRMRKAAGADMQPNAPLFVSREGHRLSCRQARHAFAVWQDRAGFSRRFRFHHLRHTSLTTLYRQTRDILLVKRQARHASITSTTIYAAPSDEDVQAAVHNLPC
jgi:integrase/recombinase XerC